MFTGLVEEKGNLIEKRAAGDAYRMKIGAEKVMEDLEIGSSIAVNGVCLTVVEKTDRFSAWM